jgi:hypothetical protein
MLIRNRMKAASTEFDGEDFHASSKRGRQRGGLRASRSAKG